MEKRHILAIGAHPDDIELMAGGAISEWIKQGHHVHGLVLSDGVWKNPQGQKMRNPEEALSEGVAAARVLGYEVENLGLEAMDLRHEDSTVVEILTRIGDYSIDTVICPWSGDLHHDHEVTSRMAISAARRVPRVLQGQINYFLRDVFTPNYFVNIEDSWDKKLEAMACYEGEWARNKATWSDFLDTTSRYYGLMSGVSRAEGFKITKFLE